MTVKRGFWFWFGFLANCVYTIAPICYAYAGITGNMWTKLGHHATPTTSGKVLFALTGIGLEWAVFLHWRKWWHENELQP